MLTASRIEEEGEINMDPAAAHDESFHNKSASGE
jgi:hypothetical protein